MAICRDDRRAAGVVLRIGVPPPDACRATVVLAMGSQRDLSARVLLAAARGAFTPGAGYTARPTLRRQSREDPPVCAPVSICRGTSVSRRTGRVCVSSRNAVFRAGVVPRVTVPTGVVVFSAAGDEGPYRCGAREGD
jgi:hypothetical protein